MLDLSATDATGWAVLFCHDPHPCPPSPAVCFPILLGDDLPLWAATPYPVGGGSHHNNRTDATYLRFTLEHYHLPSVGGWKE